MYTSRRCPVSMAFGWSDGRPGAFHVDFGRVRGGRLTDERGRWRKKKFVTNDLTKYEHGREFGALGVERPGTTTARVCARTPPAQRVAAAEEGAGRGRTATRVGGGPERATRKYVIAGRTKKRTSLRAVSLRRTKTRCRARRAGTNGSRSRDRLAPRRRGTGRTGFGWQHCPAATKKSIMIARAPAAVAAAGEKKTIQTFQTSTATCAACCHLCRSHVRPARPDPPALSPPARPLVVQTLQTVRALENRRCP